MIFLMIVLVAFAVVITVAEIQWVYGPRYREEEALRQLKETLLKDVSRS